MNVTKLNGGKLTPAQQSLEDALDWTPTRLLNSSAHLA